MSSEAPRRLQIGYGAKELKIRDEESISSNPAIPEVERNQGVDSCP
jgi:hypothetical protein